MPDKPTANRNIFAIIAIGIFLMTGAVVALTILATLFMMLYALAALILKSAFGIELPRLY